MWLIARRSFTEGWGRLVATLLAALFSVGLIAGSLDFTLRAQDAVSGNNASEYAKADVLVQGGTVDETDLYSLPDGRIKPADVAARPGVAAVAGDAILPVTAMSPEGKQLTPSAGGRTLLRPWIADARLSPYKLESGRAPAAENEVAVVRHLADANGKHDGLRVVLPQQARDVKIVGVVTVSGRGAVAGGDLILAPPATVRHLAGLPADAWQTVWVKAAPGITPATLKTRLARDFKGTATVRAAKSLRDAQAAEIASSGASVGGALSLISSVAVFTGLFVVANTFGTLVRQRTRRLALLSAIGATPRQIKRLIKLEALALGAVAGIGGAFVGVPVSALLARQFAQDGFDISAGQTRFGWVVLVSALAGLLVTQLSAWRAARAAARVMPMQALRDTATEQRGPVRKRVFGALGVLALAGLFWGLVFAVRAEEPPGPERTVGVTMVSLMGSMIATAALAVLSPLVVGPLGGLVGRLGMAFGGEAGRLARATIVRSPRRVSAAAASLMLGVALAVSTALLVMSADARFAETGAQAMRADHALAPDARTADGASALPRDAAGRVATVPGVTAAGTLTDTTVTLVRPRGRTIEEAVPNTVQVTGADQATLPKLVKLGGALRPLRDGEIALTSAILETHGLKVGQTIVVRGARGRVTLKIADAYHDPSHVFADQALAGTATMDRLDPAAPARAVLVKGGSAAAIERAAAVPGVRVLDRAAYVEVAASAMTSGTRLIYGFIGMALLLALFGMATTVSMSVGERTREFGLLGAVGTTAKQVREIVHWEAAAVVLIGTLLGVGAAFGAQTLAYAVSGSSFLRPAPPWWLLPLVAAGAAAVTLGVSALPGRRASQVPVLEAARAE
ncbi:FtsX-like permease family protein [Actinomadura hibisca]|uniref:FtsX-like permease family protein n=1 Tax=Actinomadura hibisca TaxID=68565 RepID=UPI000830ADAC|nr:ABC transporter permease [Actinomadura hibisca]